MDTSNTSIDEPGSGEGEEDIRQCEAGSYRCVEARVREVCDGDKDAFIPAPCPTNQVCQGEGACVPACLADLDIPCTHHVFSSPTAVPHTPACLGASLTIDDQGYVVLGDPCADPPTRQGSYAEGAVLVATTTADGSLTYAHTIERGDALPDELQLGTSVAILGDALLAGAPYRRESGAGRGWLVYVPDFRSPAPTTSPCKYRGALVEQSHRGDVITLEEFGMALAGDPIAGGVGGQRDGQGSIWLSGAFPEPFCGDSLGAREIFQYGFDSLRTGLDAGQAIGLRGEKIGWNRHITIYLSVPGTRDGAGFVTIISLVLTPDDAIFSQVHDGIEPIEGNVRLGEALAVGKEHVYVSAPSSPSIDHHLGWAPHIGSGPPQFYKASALGLTGYRLGDKMVTCGGDLFVLATGRDEENTRNPLLLRFREGEEGPVHEGTITLERYLPGLTPSWRAGEALACKDNLLLVGAPGAPGGGQVLSLTFHKGSQE